MFKTIILYSLECVPRRLFFNDTRTVSKNAQTDVLCKSSLDFEKGKNNFTTEQSITKSTTAATSFSSPIGTHGDNVQKQEPSQEELQRKKAESQFDKKYSHLI